MCSDHSKLTSGGSISNHFHGRGVDIAAVDGEIVNPGSIAARELATEMQEINTEYRPDEIGTPWAISGPGYFTDGGHQDHLHVGFKTEIDPNWKPPAEVASGARAAARRRRARRPARRRRRRPRPARRRRRRRAAQGRARRLDELPRRHRRGRRRGRGARQEGRLAVLHGGAAPGGTGERAWRRPGPCPRRWPTPPRRRHRARAASAPRRWRSRRASSPRAFARRASTPAPTWTSTWRRPGSRPATRGARAS